MKKVKITAVRKASHPDLMEKYETPIQHACDIKEGQVWIANGYKKPFRYLSYDKDGYALREGD